MPTRRNSIRYPGFDYHQAGWYFLTICTHDRQHLFGHVTGDGVILSPAGMVVDEACRAVSSRFPSSGMDAWVVMPDHVHGILMLGTDPLVAPDRAVPDIVGWLKNRTQGIYRRRVAAGMWEPYRGSMWQRSYHDRIIRTVTELSAMRSYIEGNPGRWRERYGRR